MAKLGLTRLILDGEVIGNILRHSLDTRTEVVKTRCSSHALGYRFANPRFPAEVSVATTTLDNESRSFS